MMLTLRGSLRNCAHVRARALTRSRGSVAREESAGVSRNAEGNGSRYIFAFAAVTTFGLGTWQLARYQWKVDLLESQKAALDLPPVDISSGGIPMEVVAASTGGEGSLRRVTVQGRLLHTQSVRVGPRPPPPEMPQSLRTAANAGYLTVTPLQRQDGSKILVLQGWTPADVDSAPTATQSSVTVTGVLRASEHPGSFAPQHSPDKRLYGYFDIPLLAEACGLHVGPGSNSTDGGSGGSGASSVDFPLLVEAVEPIRATQASTPSSSSTSASPYPVQRSLATFYTAHVMPWTHLTYAGTWFTLAAVATAIAARRGRGARARAK